ncbi:extracellular solute-binding protein [Paralcaligenes ureilyticus]|uniref:sn-glycerol-3-phosphate-binding periplasmic protein UgpB n=1 Tax=Paralcaligenes ureilyticus TaxID=627131 RepID=A0A4R3LZM9_9BURK|nr:extracellular solute-binding protein [Paralcaligenes ureilyticus]TCT05359.1 carbohydrate ABC transporter substrate-binding protein (CUT1 family) [Paralcaligenes ureilyticus]
MKIYPFCGPDSSWRAVALVGAAALFGASPAWAAGATDIQVWYSLNPHNNQVFQTLVKQFNGSQADVHVSLKAFDTPEQVEAALVAGVKTKNTPNLVQLNDDHAPDELINRSYILPLHTMLAKYPIKDAKWFVSSDHAAMRDAKGRLLAFPYMTDVPVMYYNIDAFKKAHIEPAIPARTWIGLQDQLVKLANASSRKCPYTTDIPVSINLENLAAVNNQFYTTDDNGLKAKSAPSFPMDLMYVRHLSMMISWARTELLVKPEFEAQSTQRFANRECAVLMSGSGNLGWFNSTRSLSFGVAALPYYQEATAQPGSPFVGGAAFWALDKQSQTQEKATAAFLGWLAQPKNAATWYQSTGFLPLTQQAFAQTDSAYYKNLGNWQALVADYARKPSATDRGFHVANYPKVKAMFRERLNTALNGQDPAVSALRTASAEANSIMRPGSSFAQGPAAKSASTRHTSKSKSHKTVKKSVAEKK